MKCQSPVTTTRIIACHHCLQETRISTGVRGCITNNVLLLLLSAHMHVCMYIFIYIYIYICKYINDSVIYCKIFLFYYLFLHFRKSKIPDRVNRACFLICETLKVNRLQKQQATFFAYSLV